MIPAAVTAAPAPTTDARAPDDAPRDDGFGAVMDHVAQDVAPDASKGGRRNGADDLAHAGAAANGGADPAPRPAAATGVEALLARIVVGSASSTSAAAAGKKVETSDAGDDAHAPAKPKSTDTATSSATATGADRLAAVAAFLPGVTAAVPGRTAGSQTATAAAAASVETSAAPSGTAQVALGEASLAGARDQSAAADVGTAYLEIALVGSAGYLAPTRQGAQQSPARATGSGANQAANVGLPHDAGLPSVAAGKSGDAGSSGDGASSGGRLTSGHQTATYETSAIVDPVQARPDTTVADATLQAIAGAVTSLAREGSTAASGATASPVAVALDPATLPQIAPARSLTLQLTPGDLGSVTVRLHLSGDGLDVHLAIEDHRTLAAISHAHAELSAAIGDNGYKLDSLVIQGADAPASSASSTSTAGSHDSARSQSEMGAGRGFSGGGSGGDATPQRQRATRQGGSHDGGRDGGPGGVFV